MKLSPLLISVIILFGLLIGLIAVFSLHYIVGISLGATLIILCLIFISLIRYLLQHKDYLWTANIAQFLNKRLEMLRFFLQVLFINPYGHKRLKANEPFDCKKMK